uniref:Ephrin RBD domain-containing protein n=1 Tax=Mola mola TaxID=94237 RepID=A0A3Q4BMI9_MOLML
MYLHPPRTSAAVAESDCSILCYCVFARSPAAKAYIYGDTICFHLTDPACRREGYTVQVNVNDYLDIYCPHYNITPRGTLERTVAEQYILYMVSYHGYRTCDPQMGSKRWECNRPHAPHAPIKFSEKFQRYSAFSLGYEFNVGQEYYYILMWPAGGTRLTYSGSTCAAPPVRPGISPVLALSHFLCFGVCPLLPPPLIFRTNKHAE